MWASLDTHRRLTLKGGGRAFWPQVALTPVRLRRMPVSVLCGLFPKGLIFVTSVFILTKSVTVTCVWFLDKLLTLSPSFLLYGMGVVRL